MPVAFYLPATGARWHSHYQTQVAGGIISTGPAGKIASPMPLPDRKWHLASRLPFVHLCHLSERLSGIGIGLTLTQKDLRPSFHSRSFVRGKESEGEGNLVAMFVLASKQ